VTKGLIIYNFRYICFKERFILGIEAIIGTEEKPNPLGTNGIKN